MLPALLLSFSACTWSSAPSTPVGLPGDQALRLSPASVEVGARFAADRPWTLELVVPDGLTIHGRGLPAEPAEGQPAPDHSVVQLELPVAPLITTAPPLNPIDPATALPPPPTGSFDAPRLCPPADPACPDDADGRWRAYRERTTDAGTDRVELWLASPGLTEGALARRVVAVWLPESELLQPGDRVRFTYVGRMPTTATDWLQGESAVLKPRLRYRAGPSGCSGETCWTLLPPSEVQGLRLNAGEPAILQVLAPLDVPAEEPFSVRVVTLDRFANPSAITAQIQLRVNEEPAADLLTFQGTWFQDVVVGPFQVGLVNLRAVSKRDLRIVDQWVGITAPFSRGWRHLAGDLHIQTGLRGDQPFSSADPDGDDRGGFTRARDALWYLAEVSRQDFGALTLPTHGAAWTPPPNDPAFAPGGPCELPPSPGHGEDAQALARSLQQDLPDLTTFPAWEWQGRVIDDVHRSLVNRVVLLREHSEHPHPVLPSTTPYHPPQCLIRWLDAQGYDSSNALVVQSPLRNNPRNDDLALSWRPPEPWAGLVDPKKTADLQRLGEVFSQRNYTHAELGPLQRLVMFDGEWREDPSPYPYTWRYAWRDLSARTGLVASSDQPDQKPGAVDPWPAGGLRDPSSQAGGTTFVLADPDLPERDGIFEALRQRRTYATTGIRARLNWQVSVGAQTHAMGSEIGPISRCSLPSDIDISVPGRIRHMELWKTRVGGTEPWTTAATRTAVNSGHFSDSFQLFNPVSPGTPDQTWIYYVRVFVGEDVPRWAGEPALRAGHADAVWSSPMWITWHGWTCLKAGSERAPAVPEGEGEDPWQAEP